MPSGLRTLANRVSQGQVSMMIFKMSVCHRVIHRNPLVDIWDSLDKIRNPLCEIRNQIVEIWKPLVIIQNALVEIRNQLVRIWGPVAGICLYS